jgi:hypothetical protein
VTDSEPRTVLVNAADWDGSDDYPDDAVIVNAPRPLTGVVTWTGQFRHGVFYAAAPQVPGGPDPWERFGWRRDDASRVEFITNTEIAARVQAKLDEYGTTLEEVGLTVAEMAYDMQLPWSVAGECVICVPGQCPGPDCPGNWNATQEVS